MATQQHQRQFPSLDAGALTAREEDRGCGQWPARPPLAPSGDATAPGASAGGDATGGRDPRPSPAGPGGVRAAGAALRRPAALDLQSLQPRVGSDDGGGATSENAAGDEAAFSPVDGVGGSGTSSRRDRFSHHPHSHHHPAHHMYHRQRSHSPSLTGLGAANACGPLQAVPEDAVVAGCSPSACEPPGSGGALSGGSPVPFAARSISSSFCSELSIDSPSINLTLPCQEMPSGMLVAMVDRSAEMRELFERNAPFFEQITSGVLGHAPPPPASSSPAENSAAGELLPSRVKKFLDTLFAPREQLPDRLWIDAVESQLTAAPPAMVETFRELVGYESEEEYDAALPEEDQMWLPEYDQLKDVGCSETNSDAGAESDAVDDVVVVSRGSRKNIIDDRGFDNRHLGREVALDASTVSNPSDCGLGASADRQAVSTGWKEEMQHEDEEGRVKALAV